MLQYLPALPFLPPRIPELEFSGTVVAAGSRAPPELNVGARVVAFHSLQAVILWGEGALAEYVRVPAAQAVRLPDEIDLVTASGMVGCGSTALKMVRTAAVGAGDRVLINGASSSVGSVLVQICKMKGATVVGVASGRNEELVRGLGVDEACVSSLINGGCGADLTVLVRRLHRPRLAASIPQVAIRNRTFRRHPRLRGRAGTLHALGGLRQTCRYGDQRRHPRRRHWGNFPELVRQHLVPDVARGGAEAVYHVQHPADYGGCYDHSEAY